MKSVYVLTFVYTPGKPGSALLSPAYDSNTREPIPALVFFNDQWPSAVALTRICPPFAPTPAAHIATFSIANGYS